MKQLTIRGLDAQLEKRLRKMAKDHQMSLNRAALSLMRRGAGLTESREPADAVGTSLDGFIGIWSPEDEAELLKAIEPFGQIDPELWS